MPFTRSGQQEARGSLVGDMQDCEAKARGVGPMQCILDGMQQRSHAARTRHIVCSHAASFPGTVLFA